MTSRKDYYRQFTKLRDKAKLESTDDRLTFAQALTIGPSLIAKFRDKGLISFKAGLPAGYRVQHRKKGQAHES
jgi:hypothetical protein